MYHIRNVHNLLSKTTKKIFSGNKLQKISIRQLTSSSTDHEISIELDDGY